MDRIKIHCEVCERTWSVVGQLSFYERQALESQPCPQCGAYTLFCEDVQPETGRRRRLANA